MHQTIYSNVNILLNTTDDKIYDYVHDLKIEKPPLLLYSRILTSVASYIKGSYVHRFLHCGVLTFKSSFLCPGVLTSVGVLTIRGSYV